MKLSEFVKRRTGVPLGQSGSLRNMLHRSLGAGKFSIFWQYWNPIWVFYLGKLVFKPLKSIFPPTVSLIITFVVSGFIHDLVIIVLNGHFTLLLTPWFLFMGLCVIISDYANIDYSKYAWVTRALINIVIIFSCLFLAYLVKI